MADRYTLPAKMGGYECELVRRITLVDGSPVASVAYLVDGVRVTAVLPQSWLTPVKPPLPQRPEPPIGSYFRYGDLCWYRYRSGWIPVGGHERPVRQWEWLVEGYLNRWPDACEIAIPDPFAEPVQLPAKFGRLLIGADPECCGMVCIKDSYDGDRSFGHLSPAAARDFCRAVWAAANQAERNQT